MTVPTIKRENMHRLVPELIEENYRAGQYHGSFEAVGLFLDISGFSAMTDALMQHGQHGAEVLALMMRSVFEPLVRCIFEQGGMIVGFAGDAISALYPEEGSRQESIRRVLASAWIIQKYLADNPIHQTVYGSFPISAKIGVARGKTTWGILRSKNGGNATYYFRGTAVDKSAEAEHHANAREIILTSDVYEQVRAEITAERRDAFFRLTSVGVLPAARPIHPAPVDPEVMRVFCPEILCSQELRSEFRQAVSLFISLPELSDEKLQEFMYTLFDLQERYDGLIERLDFGDKGCNILTLWGAPVTYENDIGRALNFIINLQAQAGFPLTAGVSYYISRAGFIGSDLFENYTCYGWGINLAARFMIGAPGGQIWVDERIVRRVNKRFDFIFVGEQDFKGFTRKQKVYSLLGRKPETEALFQGWPRT
jgi:class 3 adenylate cyclase